MYLVIQQSVYRHAIMGLYSDFDSAVVRAKEAIMEEPDHFHNTAVISLVHDEPIKDGVVLCGFSYNKGDNRVEENNKWNIEYGKDNG